MTYIYKQFCTSYKHELPGLLAFSKIHFNMKYLFGFIAFVLNTNIVSAEGKSNCSFMSKWLVVFF